jgi:hypothetical protein
MYKTFVVDTCQLTQLINIYPPQISCVRQLIKPNIVYKDTTWMTNRMVTTKGITLVGMRRDDRQQMR